MAKQTTQTSDSGYQWWNVPNPYPDDQLPDWARAKPTAAPSIKEAPYFLSPDFKAQQSRVDAMRQAYNSGEGNKPTFESTTGLVDMLTKLPFVKEGIQPLADLTEPGKVATPVKVTSALLNALMGTAMSPFTEASEGVAKTGKVGSEVASGINRAMNVPFDAIRTASRGYNELFRAVGVRLPDVVNPETDKALNDIFITAGGLATLGIGSEAIRSYIDTKLPEIQKLQGETHATQEGQIAKDNQREYQGVPPRPDVPEDASQVREGDGGQAGNRGGGEPGTKVGQEVPQTKAQPEGVREQAKGIEIPPVPEEFSANPEMGTRVLQNLLKARSDLPTTLIDKMDLGEAWQSAYKAGLYENAPKDEAPGSTGRGAATEATIKTLEGSPENLVASVPRSELHPELSQKIADDAKQKLDEIESAKRYGQGPSFRRFNEGKGWESQGLGGGFTISSFPDWFTELGKNREDVANALRKIIEDKGTDKGPLVAQLKKVIFQHLSEGQDFTGEKVYKGGEVQTEGKIRLPADEDVAGFLDQFGKNRVKLDEFNKAYEDYLGQQTEFPFGENQKQGEQNVKQVEGLPTEQPSLRSALTQARDYDTIENSVFTDNVPPALDKLMGSASKDVPAMPTNELIDRTPVEPKEYASNLDDQFYTLKKQNTADALEARDWLKKLPITPAEAEAMYHYKENPGEGLTAPELQKYNEFIKPLADENARIYSKLKNDGVPVTDETYAPRFVKDKGNMLERILNQRQRLSGGGLLSKSAESFKHRTMKALEDEEGNRVVVSVKDNRVTAFRNGESDDLGPLKRPKPKQVTEFYDEVVMDKLNKLAQDLGIKHERTAEALRGGPGGSAAGLSYTGMNLVRTRAATPEDVLLHEIGHQLDERYGLQKYFGLDKPTAKNGLNDEFRKLADLRFEGSEATPAFRKYVRKGTEKIAVMFQAYLHAPEKFKEVAPSLYAKFEAFLNSSDATKPILDIKPSLVLGSDVVGEKRTPGVFVDKNGKQWKLGEATTKEIEAQTKLRYHKNLAANEMVTYLKLRRVERAVDFLEKLKSSPDFRDVAFPATEGNPPTGWKLTSVPQLRGYFFEPHVADTLNKFGQKLLSGADDPYSAFQKINNFLRTSIFFNPLIHVPNIADHWLVARGLSPWVTPKDYVRLFRTGLKAIDAVVHQNADYVEALNQGAPLLFGDVLTENLSKLFLEKMGQELNGKPELTKQLAGAFGYANPERLIGAIYEGSKRATWLSNDIFTLQAIYERMDKTGEDMPTAIKEIGKHIPNYRVPARILNSRALGKLMTDPNLTMFGPYHYGMLRSYGETIKDLALGSGESRLHAVDRLLMLGVLNYAIYPLVESVIQRTTGEKDLTLRRPGASSVLEIAEGLGTGSMDLPQAAQRLVTPSVATEAGAELFFNRNFFTGEPIYNPQDLQYNPLKLAKDVGSFASQTVAPVSSATRVFGGKQTARQFAMQFFGIRDPKLNNFEARTIRMIYDERPQVITQMKRYLSAGKQDKAVEMMNDYNRRLRDNYIGALEKRGKDIPNAAGIDAYLKSYFVRLPEGSAVQQFEERQQLSPFERATTRPQRRSVGRRTTRR